MAFPVAAGLAGRQRAVALGRRDDQRVRLPERGRLRAGVSDAGARGRPVTHLPAAPVTGEDHGPDGSAGADARHLAPAAGLAACPAPHSSASVDRHLARADWAHGPGHCQASSRHRP
ncbi:hypothetical protein [Haloechinothrix salitolerans]|uniref:Uncharacterized protein n=1 Tax=Haloechinothrix salitolerans TaxID=926830 RepID=A0ABW2BS73_9PSEU